MASYGFGSIEKRMEPTRKRKRVIPLSSDEDLSTDELKGRSCHSVSVEKVKQDKWTCRHCKGSFVVTYGGFPAAHASLCKAEQECAPDSGSGLSDHESEGDESDDSDREVEGRTEIGEVGVGVLVESGDEEGPSKDSSQRDESDDSEREVEEVGVGVLVESGDEESKESSERDQSADSIEEGQSESYIETSDDGQGRPKRFKGLTADETAIDGLQTGKGPKLDIVSGESAGRGVLAGEDISKGSFVCEYKTSAVYNRKKRPEIEARHQRNGMGCYIVETQHAVPGFGHLCFDATERFFHPGRYINHVARGANVRLTRPFEVRGKVRVGFLALKDIPEGDELAYDYGDRGGGEWMREGRLVEGRVVSGTGKSATAEKPSVSAAAPPGRKQAPFRKSYYCPLPECAEKPPKEKLSNHIRQYHGLKGQEANRVLKKKILATRAQTLEKVKRKRPETRSGDIRALIAGTSAPTDEAERSPRVRGKGKGKGKVKASGSSLRKGKGNVKAGGGSVSKGKSRAAADGGEGPNVSGTRDMGRHSGAFFDGLLEFLTSRAGRKKTDKSARGVVTNASKYLYWCDPSVVDTQYLTQTKRVHQYIEMLEGMVGPSGLQQHISDIGAALRFCVYEAEGTSDEETFGSRAEATLRKLSDLKASFHGEKSQNERGKLEDLADNLPSTSDVCDFLQSSSITELFTESCSVLRRDPSATHYYRALTICAGRLLFRNAQRPGAICNMTLQEYDKAVVHGEGDEKVVMVRVAQHKTGRTESASVNCSGDLVQQLETWVRSRRLLIPESGLVFPKWDGTGPILDLTARVKTLGERLHLSLPSAQKLRSIVEIRATPLDSEQKSLVARSLSHSEQTAEKHYRAAQPSKRAEGFGMVGQLVGLPATPPISKVDPIPAKRKRNWFTEEQEAIVFRDFAEEIRTERPPNKPALIAFLEKYPEVFSNKLPKDIYDKVRNAYRNKK